MGSASVITEPKEDPATGEGGGVTLLPGRVNAEQERKGARGNKFYLEGEQGHLRTRRQVKTWVTALHYSINQV